MTAAILHVACFLDLFSVSPHSFFGHSKVWGSEDHLAVEGGGGGGGGGGVIGDFRKKHPAE